MSRRNINYLHTALKELCRTQPAIAGTHISITTELGETLTIQVTAIYVTMYAQNKIPQNTYPQTIFWRYSDDAFVDCVAALPDYVFRDVAWEVKRYREASYVDVEEVK